MKQIRIKKLKVNLAKGISLNFANTDINFKNKYPLILIRGQNGSGKTTLLNLLSGYLKPTSGSVVLDGTLISGRGVRWSNKNGIVRGFQFPLLSNELSVWENIALPLMVKWWLNPHKFRNLIIHRLRKLELESHVDKSPAELSFGQRRIIEMIRIEMQLQKTQPNLLLLDEPLAGLDNFRRRKVTDIIHKVLTFKIPTIIVEHDTHLGRLGEIAKETELILSDGDKPEIQFRKIIRNKC